MSEPAFAAEPQETEVDEVDQAAADAFEALVAATLAGMALDAMSGPASVLPGGGDWGGRITAALGFGIKAYLVRAAFRMLEASGVTGPAAAEIVNEVVPKAEAEAVARLGAAMRGMVEKASSRAGEASPWPRTPSGPGAPDEADVGADAPSASEAADTAYRRIRVGSAQLARESSTAMREGIRSELAEGLGATRKTWRTRMDPKVRMSHGALEGETVEMWEPFRTVNGAELAFPGDPTAPIGEVANCRCRLSYSLPANPDRFKPKGGKLIQISGPGDARIQSGDRVTPIAAAAGENDAREGQLRDANGRWVQMGSSVSFEYVGGQRTGEVVGSPKEGWLRVRTPGGYVIDVPASRTTVRKAAKARLSKPASKPASKPRAKPDRPERSSSERSSRPGGSGSSGGGSSRRRPSSSSGSSRDPRLAETKGLLDDIESAISDLARRNGRRDPFRDRGGKDDPDKSKDSDRVDARRERRKAVEYGKAKAGAKKRDDRKRLTRAQIDKVNGILEAALADIKKGSVSGALSKLAAASQVLDDTSAPWLILRIDKLVTALKGSRKPIRASGATVAIVAAKHPNVPGVPGRSESWRTQLRDRNGKWIEMGAEVKWLIRGVLQAGRVVDSPKPGRVTVETKRDGVDTPVLLSLPANRLTVSAPAKASLGDAPDAPEVPNAPDAPDAPDAPEVPDAPRAPDAPDVLDRPQGRDLIERAPEEAVVGARGIAVDIEAEVEDLDDRRVAAEAVAAGAVSRLAARLPNLEGRFEGSWADKADAAREVLTETIALNYDVAERLITKTITWIDEYVAPSSPGVGGMIAAFGLPNPFNDPAGFLETVMELITNLLEAVMGLVA